MEKCNGFVNILLALNMKCNSFDCWGSEYFFEVLRRSLHHKMDINWQFSLHNGNIRWVEHPRRHEITISDIEVYTR